MCCLDTGFDDVDDPNPTLYTYDPINGTEPPKDREIDWSKVPVDTPVLVCDDTKEWEPRYFQGYTKGKVDLFITFISGKRSHEAIGVVSWHECKLNCEPKEEWYV